MMEIRIYNIIIMGMPKNLKMISRANARINRIYLNSFPLYLKLLNFRDNMLILLTSKKQDIRTRPARV
jgi:hypothetical protein